VTGRILLVDNEPHQVVEQLCHLGLRLVEQLGHERSVSLDVIIRRPGVICGAGNRPPFSWTRAEAVCDILLCPPGTNDFAGRPHTKEDSYVTRSQHSPEACPARRAAAIAKETT
jgi:hypothetical protein